MADDHLSVATITQQRSFSASNIFLSDTAITMTHMMSELLSVLCILFREAIHPGTHLEGCKTLVY